MLVTQRDNQLFASFVRKGKVFFVVVLLFVVCFRVVSYIHVTFDRKKKQNRIKTLEKLKIKKHSTANVDSTSLCAFLCFFSFSSREEFFSVQT